jgi:hypothetical protein
MTKDTTYMIDYNTPYGKASSICWDIETYQETLIELERKGYEYLGMKTEDVERPIHWD